MAMQQEFPSQHPYSNHDSHRSPALPPQSPGIVPVNGLGRPAPTPPFMLENPYPGLNGQGIPYHVNVSADKNILMASPGLSHHQGNLQPGYPPRPMENTSRNSDSMCSVSSSSGYPGYDRTGMVKLEPGEATPLQSPQNRELENQHQQVSSSRHHSGAPVRETKETGPGLLRGREGNPSDSSILLQSSHRPPDPYHPPFNLPQPQQPHFLAYSAAGAPAIRPASDPRATELNKKLLHPDQTKTLSDSAVTASQLARTPAAPKEEKSFKPHSPTFNSSNQLEALRSHSNEQKARRQDFSENSQQKMPKKPMTMAAQRVHIKKMEKSRNASFDSSQDSSMLDSSLESSFGDNSVNSPGRTKTDPLKDEGSSCRTPLEIYNEVYNDLEDQERVWTKEKVKEIKDFMPPCDCGPEAMDNGPYYTHLGHAATSGDLRKQLEERLRVTGSALRMEKIRYTGQEGKTREDCPIAKWILRRGNLAEKFMCVWKERPGHMCEYAVTITALICWDALSKQIAGKAYDEIASKMADYGCETERQCGANKRKTCACQGLTDFPGASYTYGCSWSMYQNCCKFSRSQKELVRKYRTTNEEVEDDLEQALEDVTDQVAAWHEMMSPDSFRNMTLFEEVADACRVGRNKGQRPYSGVTTVVDFCAHSHRDSNNMVAGTTGIVTLTRPENRKLGKQEDEQFHVLPLYVPDMSKKEIDDRVASGQLEVLQKFHRTLAIREKPMLCAKRGRPTMEKKKMLDGHVSETYDPSAVFGKGSGSSPGRAPRRMSQGNPSPSRGASRIKQESADNDGYLPENINNLISGTEYNDLPQFSFPVSQREEGQGKTRSPAKVKKEEWSFQPGPTQPKLPKSEPGMPQFDGASDEIPQLDGTNDQHPYHGQHNNQYYQYAPQQQQQYYQNYNYMPQYNHPQNPQIYHPQHVQVAPQQPNLLNLDQNYRPNQLPQSPEIKSEPSEIKSEHSEESSPSQSNVKAEGEIFFEETDCSEAFSDPNIGGVALALPHGSLCLEVAKNELHATTALTRPNKKHPCRIGLVFYQHKNLHFPEHGLAETKRRQHLRDVRDYKAWLDGTFVPTSRKVQQLQEYGFIFPENVKTVDRTQEARPEDYYREGDFPGFKPSFPDDILTDRHAQMNAPTAPVEDEIELKPEGLPTMINSELQSETDSDKLQHFVKNLQN